MSDQTLTRRDLISFHARRRVSVLLPPGALPSSEFYERCTGCSACINACEQSLLRKDFNGFPYREITAGFCTACNACIDVCESRALSVEEGGLNRAQVSNTCLNAQNVMCQSCQDFCDQRAISISLQDRLPRINKQQCTGCGACIQTCPVNAIQIISMAA